VVHDGVPTPASTQWEKISEGVIDMVRLFQVAWPMAETFLLSPVGAVKWMAEL